MNIFDGSNPLLFRLCPALVGVVFLVTGTIKTLRPQAFFRHVKDYGILPNTSFLPPLLLAFIGFECALGLALVFIPAPPVLALTAALLLGFIGLTIWGTVTERVEDCGCYGDLISLRPWQSIALDFVYLALILTAWWLQPASSEWMSWWGAFVAFLVGAGAYLLAGRNAKRPMESLLQPHRPWRASWLRQSPRDLSVGKHLVVFLGRECPYCKRWMPLLNVIEVQPDLPGVMAVMALSEAEVQQFKSEHLIHFPIARMQRTLHALLADSVPTAVLIEDGMIQEQWVGEMPASYLERIKSFFDALRVETPPKRKAFLG